MANKADKLYICIVKSLNVNFVYVKYTYDRSNGCKLFGCFVCLR